jgi:hypothetical protein
MTTNFRVGDVCVIVDNGKFNAEEIKYIGTEVTLVGSVACFCGCGAAVWFVDRHFDGTDSVMESALRLKRPPDEPRADFTPGEWELCPWKPNKVRA